MNRTGRLVLTGLAATGVLATGGAAVAAGVSGSTAATASADASSSIAVSALREQLAGLQGESQALQADLTRATAAARPRQGRAGHAARG